MGFFSSAKCSLGGIGSGGGVSRIFGIWPHSVFYPSMGCGGRWKFLPSAQFLFVYLFDRSDVEEDFKLSLFTARGVMLLMVFISSEALISLTLVASLNISVNRATHHLFILKFSGSVSLIYL